MSTNITISGSTISHTPGNSNITLAANTKYLVNYRAVGNNVVAGLDQVIYLSLDGAAIPGTTVTSSGNGYNYSPESNGTAIITTGGAPSQLTIVNNSGGTSRTFSEVQISLVQIA
ncbi:MAG: hypothetical protein ACRDDX_07975 [Cellulosilyticaceae bacterium]